MGNIFKGAECTHCWLGPAYYNVGLIVELMTILTKRVWRMPDLHPQQPRHSVNDEGDRLPGLREFVIGEDLDERAIIEFSNINRDPTLKTHWDTLVTAFESQYWKRL